MNLRSLTVPVALLIALLPAPLYAQQKSAPKQHNVILFVADGLRRGSVNETDTPTLAHLRTAGVDFENSHSVFPTFTTANASAIATGHGLGDTGDYSNTIYPGLWLSRPDVPAASGNLTPFLENDEVLANMNGAFQGNYLGEKTLLGSALAKGINVAAIGKLGPTAIQLNDTLGWDEELGLLSSHGAIIIDDSTGQANGIPLSPQVTEWLTKAGLPFDAPLRTNGYPVTSQASNGFSGDATTSGTLDANRIQQQWFADVATKALLPQLASSQKPFVLLFWSRDPDGTQHNQGDSLQRLSPGINGDTETLALRNADHCLKQLLDWLDAHPEVKANTDVIVTSDHGFATISRREIAADGTETAEPSAHMTYETVGKEKPEPPGTLPTGFLAIDLAIRSHMRVFDPEIRTTTGESVYAEVNLGGEKSQHPVMGSALLGDPIKSLDGSDAKLIVAANGGSDLIYVPSHDPSIVHSTLQILTQLDYVGGIFVDDQFCKSPSECPGALPLSAISLVGRSHVPRPAIVVSFKHFYLDPGNLQTAVQISDTTLQEGQGMHGGFGREQTFNNMAAIGPDFKSRFADQLPVGNIDIAPTIAHILGFDLASSGGVHGRVMSEALSGSNVPARPQEKTLRSAPTLDGSDTLLQYQDFDGVRYFDRACFLSSSAITHCD